jgi:hypothetical protein
MGSAGFVKPIAELLAEFADLRSWYLFGAILAPVGTEFTARQTTVGAWSFGPGVHLRSLERFNAQLDPARLSSSHKQEANPVGSIVTQGVRF